MRTLIRSVALATIAFSAIPAFAANLSTKDHKYVKETAEGLMAEIQLGEMAEKQGQDERVKQFGKQMVEDMARTCRN